MAMSVLGGGGAAAGSKFDLIWTRNHGLREKKFFLCVEAIFFNFSKKNFFFFLGGGGQKKFWVKNFF